MGAAGEDVDDQTSDLSRQRPIVGAFPDSAFAAVTSCWIPAGGIGISNLGEHLITA
jgi:hypothetical protein